MDLGDGGPDSGAVLAVSVAEVFACLRREFLRATEMFWPSRWRSSCLGVWYVVILRTTTRRIGRKPDMPKPGQRVTGEETRTSRPRLP
jgi:hypothetical protein